MVPNNILVANFEPFMTMMFQVEVVWVVMPWSSGWRWRQHGPLKC